MRSLPPSEALFLFLFSSVLQLNETSFAVSLLWSFWASVIYAAVANH